MQLSAQRESTVVGATALAVGAALGWVACVHKDVSATGKGRGRALGPSISAPPGAPCLCCPAGRHPLPLFSSQRIRSTVGDAATTIKSSATSVVDKVKAARPRA